tara:strand:+ start:564 stop:710 length:147 start_codon:yes stop_codon:yes gene_type:complete
MKKRPRSLTVEERVVFDYWIQDGKYDNYPKEFRDADCWEKDSPEEITE